MMATSQLVALTQGEFQELAKNLTPQQRRLLELLFTGATNRKGMKRHALAAAAPQANLRFAPARKLRDAALGAIRQKDGNSYERLVSKGIRRQ